MANINLTKVDNTTNVSLNKGATKDQLDSAVNEVVDYRDECAQSASEAESSASTASTKASEASASASTAATYASQAASSAISAAASEAAALVSENAAQSSEDDAETAQIAAEAAQSAAETAETNAELAETNAETAQSAAQSAQTSAESAQTSAETAQSAAESAQASAESSAASATASATSAASSATDAQSSEDDAEISAIAAANSATASASSATSASSSATTATTQAGIATTQATNASNSATASATSASSAATSESNASTSESNAATSATQAANSATEASGYATIAGTYDSTYQGYLSDTEDARDAAQLAQTGAETAETNAGTYASNASTNASNASTSESNASDSATSAASSASTATTQAGVSTTQAGIATTQAGNASTSASNAATSETNAATSATNASTSETNAANSASAASTSETNAATSETNAATSASNASTSETNASTSETNASNSASAASTSATNASTSETNAANSATSASGSASTATTQAGIATTKASEASTSATNAATSESNASDSEDAASASASAAAASASSASTSASNASTSETNASNSATAAAGSASSASSSASTATTQATNASNSANAAGTAQLAAEAARDSALAAYDSFDDRYLGAKASAPTVDNDGDALVAGTLYFDTTAEHMKLYTGSEWVAAYVSAEGALFAANNLSDLTNASTARTNLGLGSAATTDSGAYEPADSTILKDADIGSTVQGYDANIVSDASYNHITVTSSSVSDGTNTFNKYTLPSDVVQDASYVHTDNNYTSTEKSKLAGIEDGAEVNPTNVSELTNDSGYISANQTITLSGDVSGSGTTSINVTIAGDSHNHTIANVDGLQTALDGKTYIGGTDFSGTYPAMFQISGTNLYSQANMTYTGSTETLNVVNVNPSGTVDGRDIASDGSKLDGIEAGATADQTASEILTAIKTVDGSGSGLDADTVDGQHASSFASASHTHSYLPLTGGTLTGDLTLNSTNPTINFNGTSDTGIDMAIRATPEGLDFHEPEDGNKIHFQILDDHGVNSPYGYKVGSNTVWHSGNDGSGSGLDADLLDGYNCNRFFRRVGKATATVGGGWMTVATCGSGRYHGEVIVTDADNRDHSFIRIDWMRSFTDSNFTVINCGGHNNRITGARVLYQTSDNTYGEKILQVYVTTSSNYEVNVYEIGDIDDYEALSVHTPTIENSISGYAVHGNELTGLDSYGHATEEGILAGGPIRSNSGFIGDGSQLTGIDADPSHAGMSAGQVGSYAFCFCSLNVSAGGTVAGSSLKYGGVNPGVHRQGATLSGTWRCMGHSTTNGLYTLFLRIS